MKIACFNVNSINARLLNVLDWLKNAQPGVVCLQELKCEEHKFPREEIEALGYNCLVHGQKSYNGVAILSKLPIEEERRALPLNEEDEQSRFLEAIISAPNGKAIRVICVYCPNGNPVDTPKFDYKLAWMARLIAHCKNLLELEEAFVVCGDWNIIPRPEDCHDPKAWENDALFRAESRAKWHELLNLGLTDSFMALDGRAHQYTFWDYQGGAWPRDLGIHIDTHLLSPQAADLLKSHKIWRNEREMPKASDHVPVSIELAL
ncbi:MAG: exodeoxyribonuclease III [Caulobacterales bacterium]|nr:exodeoxyribonuclease III [Caulobacterales bacterium]MCA0373285.1 exodeoxyribonuclease III [Pseudomonadota bacterium]